MLQPVLVRPLAGGRYELLAGERRLRAARIAGLERLPAVVRSAPESERLELAMIENMARQDLNPVDAARACAALVEEFGLTKEEVGRRVGRSRVAISNLVRLLELPDEVLSMLEAGELSEGHGRAVLQAPDHNARRRIAREARERVAVGAPDRGACARHRRGAAGPPAEGAPAQRRRDRRGPRQPRRRSRRPSGPRCAFAWAAAAARSRSPSRTSPKCSRSTRRIGRDQAA